MKVFRPHASIDVLRDDRQSKKSALIAALRADPLSEELRQLTLKDAALHQMTPPVPFHEGDMSETVCWLQNLLLCMVFVAMVRQRLELWTTRQSAKIIIVASHVSAFVTMAEIVLLTC